MAQEFDPDVCRKLKACVQNLREGAIKQLPTAAEVVAGQAQESGATNLIKSVENFKTEGIPNMTKLFNEMLDACDKYIASAEMYFEKTGVEY